jgi:signal transduction histidine kinase
MGHTERTDQSGIQFFGKMSASISHDLKNVLAVINENAGLLEDLSLLAEKGAPIDSARVKRVAADVKDQIRRADRIVTTMNRFAHSADEADARIDARELLALLAALAARFAAMRGVALELDSSGEPLMVTTAPFVLLNLLWQCLEHAMTACGAGRRVTLGADAAAGAARFRLRWPETTEPAAGAGFPTGREDALMRALGARVIADAGPHELTVLLSSGNGDAAAATLAP